MVYTGPVVGGSTAEYDEIPRLLYPQLAFSSRNLYWAEASKLIIIESKAHRI